jgi:hypothetical protein
MARAVGGARPHTGGMRSYLMTLTLALGCLYAQKTLPQGPAAKETGPQPYRFVCDYYNLSIKGDLTNRDRFSARYTRNLPDGKVRWDDVTHATGKEYADTFAAPEKREFMNGFTYRLSDQADMLKPDFFPASFPVMAMQERNLVWDTHMLESFVGPVWDKLALNTPYHFESGEVPLGAAGSFLNRDIQLTLHALVERNGVPCALIDYRAFFNKVNVTSPAVTLNGRSHYWGQIWASLATRQIEYATLYEDVLGELKLPALEKPMTVNVFRIGSFERAAK